MIKKIASLLLCLSLVVIGFSVMAEENQSISETVVETQASPIAEKPMEEDANPESIPAGNQPPEGGRGDWGKWGEQGNPGRAPSFGQNQVYAAPMGFFEIYFDAIASVVLLVLAFIFVIFYKRRQY